MTAKIFDLVTYRAAHPGSAVRVQVHFDPLWAWKFWVGYWEALKK